uniref:Uncharacterized protein n=1 Tax=Timema shepardi TaxID=629360 RepID=A0A7R9G010_TIMSH|nr:unnamed protein product [Timema shepardi]
MVRTPDQDLKLELPVIGSMVYCESSALDHAGIEAGSFVFVAHSMLDVITNRIQDVCVNRDSQVRENVKLQLSVTGLRRYGYQYRQNKRINEKSILKESNAASLVCQGQLAVTLRLRGRVRDASAHFVTVQMDLHLIT